MTVDDAVGDLAALISTSHERWAASYGARCQHSDDVLGLFPDVDHSRGRPRLLAELLER